MVNFIVYCIMNFVVMPAPGKLTVLLDKPEEPQPEIEAGMDNKQD